MIVTWSGKGGYLIGKSEIFVKYKTQVARYINKIGIAKLLLATSCGKLLRTSTDRRWWKWSKKGNKKTRNLKVIWEQATLPVWPMPHYLAFFRMVCPISTPKLPLPMGWSAPSSKLWFSGLIRPTIPKQHPYTISRCFSTAHQTNRPTDGQGT